MAADARDAGEAIFTCAACGAQLPERRREAHETMWCPALDAAQGLHRSALPSSGDEATGMPEEDSSDTDDDARGGSLRHRGGGVMPGMQRRCPHGFIAGHCAQCIDLGKSDALAGSDPIGGSDPLGGPDPLAETPKVAQRRAWLSFCFLIIMVGPACVAGFMMLQEFFYPALLRVSSDDAATVQKIFFGGDPWVVYCVNKRTSGGKHLKALTKASELLRPEGIRIAEVDCWKPLPTKKGPRTLARRFKFRDSPPVAMFVAKRETPRLLNSQDLTAEGLARQAKQQALSPSTARRESREDPRAETTSRHAKQQGRNSRARGSGRRDHVGKRPQNEDFESPMREEPKQSASAGPESVGDSSDEEDGEVVDLDT